MIGSFHFINGRPTALPLVRNHFERSPDLFNPRSQYSFAAMENSEGGDANCQVLLPQL